MNSLTAQRDAGIARIPGASRSAAHGLCLAIYGAALMIQGATLQTSEVTTFREFGRLKASEAALGRPVSFRGIVLCYDPAWGQFYVHDGAETKWFSPSEFNVPCEAGQRVNITGSTAFAEGYPRLTNGNLTIVGKAPLPGAVAHSLRDLTKDFGQWIQTTGQVRVADFSRGRLALVLQAEGQSGVVYVMGTSANENFQHLIGATIRVRGINGSKSINRQLVSVTVFVPSVNEITILQPTFVEPSKLPVSSIDTLLSRELGDWTNHVVRLSGVITAYSPGEFVQMTDPTGEIRAHVMQMTRTQRDDRIDLWGYLSFDGNRTVLKDAFFEVLQAPVQTPVRSPVAAYTTNTEAVFTKAAQVVRLSREQAAEQHAVRLQGVVIFADSDWRNGFLHDETGEVYFDLTQADIHAGQWVELFGQTSPGGFAPEVTGVTLKVLGTTNLPVAAKVGLEDLAGGQMDAHWVELEGVVRNATAEWGHITLTLVTRKGRFRAVIPNLENRPVPQNLVDALVGVRGACSSEMNARGQLRAITLHVPSLEQLTIFDAMPTDPFSIRATLVQTVATFDPERLAGRRVKVSGTVTMIMPSRGFFLQDKTGGIRVSTSATTNLNMGDQVEVLAFPSMGDFSPCLEEAEVRKSGSGKLPPARPTTAEQVIVQGLHDSTLVELNAQLSKDVVHSAHQRLSLQEGSVIFTASLESSARDNRLDSLAAGSILRLRGICCIQGNDEHNAESFRLLLSDSSDIQILKEPSWWNLKHTAAVTGGLGLGIMATLGWILSLRRHVRAQTRIIEQKHKELMEISRRAGMAEVATGVLHNVGNVLNSVNVSANLMAENLRHSKARQLTRVAAILKQHESGLEEYLSADSKGKQIPGYLADLGELLNDQEKELEREVALLQKNVAHIKDIVAMQQEYARVAGVTEVLPVIELVEDALKMNEGALERHGLKLVRQYEDRPPVITVEKQKVLQVLINLIRNAKYACDESSNNEKQITVSIQSEESHVSIRVIDNGIGIPAENLTRIFSHGFSTRKNGHGFGLHNGALIARELGGSLRAQSAGPGKGAAFTLELPLSHAN